MLLVDLILFIFTKWGLKITLNYGAIWCFDKNFFKNVINLITYV